MALRILLTLYAVTFAGCDLLSEHPSKFPGHLEPMAAKQTKIPVETLSSFPEPEEFFRDFVDASRPALFKGVVKNSPAYEKWTDEFLASGKSESTMVYVEPGLKENRTNPGEEISLSDFIRRYHEEEMYLVSGVPSHLMPDVPMPPPLRCEETRPYLLDAVTWFSSGGTKSVLHNDDLDNINCLYRGSKDLLFIEYAKYNTKVDIDRPQGGYSALDVEKVDFVKYPGLREVEYVYARMEEGDCLFIPYRWFHQVNSFHNKESKQNLAINVWFKHVHKHQPKTCKMTAEEGRLSDFKFVDLEKQKYSLDNSTDDPQESMIATFEGLLQYTKTQTLTLRQFTVAMARSGIFDREFKKMKLPDLFKETVAEMFAILDKDASKKLTVKDFDLMEKDGNSEAADAQLESSVAKLQDMIRDYIEAQHHGLTEEEFEEQVEKKQEAEAQEQKPLMGSAEAKTEL